MRFYKIIVTRYKREGVILLVHVDFLILKNNSIYISNCGRVGFLVREISLFLFFFLKGKKENAKTFVLYSHFRKFWGTLSTTVFGIKSR